MMMVVKNEIVVRWAVRCKHEMTMDVAVGVVRTEVVIICNYSMLPYHHS